MVTTETTETASDIGKSERSSLESSTKGCLRKWKETNIGWLASYYLMCITHVLGVSLKNQLFEFTAIVLSTDLALVGNGMLFSFNVVVSFFAGAIVSQLGTVYSQLLGHVLMLGFVAFLSVCVFLGSQSWLQWPLYLAGVLIASVVAQPVENTMMGPLVERTAIALVAESTDDESKEDEEDKENQKDTESTVKSMRADLMATFTVCVGLTHVVVNSSTGALLGILEENGGELFAIKVMFPCLTFLIFLALVIMIFVREPPTPDVKSEKKDCMREMRNMCGLWRDPRIWLLGFAPLSLGFANAWKLVALTKRAKQHLGVGAVAHLLLVQSAVQIILPKIIGRVYVKTGACVWVGFGALNYMLMPVLFWTATSLTENWGIATWYAMLGIAWSIYDVVSRSVVLEHFPKEQASYAFATMNVQMFSTTALTFILKRNLASWQIGIIMLAVSACMLPGYLVAEYLKKRREGEAGQTESSDCDECSQNDTLP